MEYKPARKSGKQGPKGKPMIQTMAYKSERSIIKIKTRDI